METLPDKSAFSAQLHTIFRVNAGNEQAIDLELVEMTEGRPNPRIEQFALLFRGPSDVSLPQQSYPVKHDRLGGFDLFLVPVGKDAKGTYYEAVFSRFTGA